MKLFTMRSAYVAILVAGAFAVCGPGPAALPTESVSISLTDVLCAMAALGRAVR
jgi:hypothetical protein